jgi:hypothetical protein
MTRRSMHEEGPTLLVMVVLFSHRPTSEQNRFPVRAHRVHTSCVAGDHLRLRPSVHRQKPSRACITGRPS